MSVQYGGDKITFGDGSTLGSGWAGFKNRIINGAMMIDQRNAGASVALTNSWTYPVDRFSGYAGQNSKLTAQQSTTAPDGFKNSIVVTSLSSYSSISSDEFLLQQIIEGLNISDLGWGTANGKPVTLSFWVRSSLTGTFSGVIKNSAYDRSYVFTYSITTANTWTNVSITIPADTGGTWLSTNGAGMRIWWNLGSGSTFLTSSTNTWLSGAYDGATGSTNVVGTNGATFYITGVQLEKGSTATSFDYRPYGTELALCQRYFYLHAFSNSAPIGTGFYYTTSQIRGHIFYKQPMRTAPTAVISTGTNFYYLGANGANDLFDALSINENSVNGCELFSSSGAVSGTAGVAGTLVCQNASSSVAFSAEL